MSLCIFGLEEFVVFEILVSWRQPRGEALSLPQTIFNKGEGPIVSTQSRNSKLAYKYQLESWFRIRISFQA